MAYTIRTVTEGRLFLKNYFSKIISRDRAFWTDNKTVQSGKIGVGVVIHAPFVIVRRSAMVSAETTGSRASQNLFSRLAD